jgi:enamine deaminase RidA (YjgF/YER057c/UK114 family)
MSDSKTYFFGNEGANGNLLASLIPALQNRGIDSSYLMGLMSGNNNGGFFGNNGGFQDIIALIVIAAIFGNGNGNGLFGGGNNNSAEREMLMSAIQRNGTDISQLAQSLNCSTGRINDAISQVATQICQLSGQVGMSGQQIINSIQFGNSQLANQIASCCCDLKSSLASCCCDIQRDIASTNSALTRGFADVGYALRDQTCNIEKAIAASTSQILEGQRAAEMREMQDKMDALREKNAQQAVFLNNAQQTAQFSAMLQPIAEDLASIKCKLPKTETITVQPDYIPINRSVNVPYGPYCGGFGGFGFGNFSGWGNGCGNNSLWG